MRLLNHKKQTNKQTLGQKMFNFHKNITIKKTIIFFKFSLCKMQLVSFSWQMFSSALCLCWLTGVYRSLQQSYNVSSQDVLTAMDYCEESLQEIDITSFLQTLCGHIRVFRERHELHGCVNVSKSSNGPTTFIIGEGEDDGADRATLVSSSRYWPQSKALWDLMLCFHFIQKLFVFLLKYWTGGCERSWFQRKTLCPLLPAGPGWTEVS